MKKNIAIFGGSFDPPGLHHRRIAEELAKYFDKVIVVPCGTRLDKITTVDPVHRASMVDATFRGMKNVEVELFDLENATFTRTHELDERFREQGNIWHVIGTEWIYGGSQGKSAIEISWERGLDVWQELQFVVITRQGFDYDSKDLPPKYKLLNIKFVGSSAKIREELFRHQPINQLVTSEVDHYIKRYGLYRGRIPNRMTRYSLSEPKLKIVLDERNPKSVELAEIFHSFENNETPNCILVIGGDGTMLHAIRQNWRLRLPFLGINAGHLGFLLNDPKEVLEEKFPPKDLILRQMPLLYVETITEDGRLQSELAFNDTWVERATSQTAWLEIKLNGQVKLPKLIADGVLVATAAGSTAYARAMGAMPLLADTPALLLVGSNVLNPFNWKSVLLSYDAEIAIRNLDPTNQKRPLNAYVDGLSQGRVRSMFIRVSRIAAAEVAFFPNHDMAEKIAQIQFPLN
ncbi:MAG: NAD(+)/NADH kinase [Acidobacteria bacterium]|nr:NAD(+)/NADH kinase [Acidobacteriota bacterium]